MLHQAKAIGFAEDLAVLLNSGADLSGALATIIETLEPGEFKIILQDIRNDLQEGQPLDAALAGHPQVFDNYFIGMIKSGQASGHLAGSLDSLASRLESDRELRNKIATAMIYPAILTVAMCLSLVVILSLILPRFTDLFESFGTDLSPAAQLMLGIGNFVNDWGLWIGSALGILVIICWLLREQLQPRAVALRVLSRIPGIKTILNQIDFARFSASLASLLESGLSQVDALTIASESCSQAHNREQLGTVVQQVRQGRTLGSSLAEVDGVGQLYAHSISNGERGGQLPLTLRKLADRLEKDFSTKAQRVALLVEPTLIILLGLIIGLVVYTVFSALQNLGNLPL